MLSENGIVIVHDAQRAIYQKAFDVFNHSVYDKDSRTAVLSDNKLDFLSDETPIWYETVDITTTMIGLITLMQNKMSFWYVRFGDGELYCIDEPLFGNKRHQPKDSKMSAELERSFSIKDHAYKIACLLEGKRPSITRRLRKIAGGYHKKAVFYSPIAIHTTFLKNIELFKSFTDQFKGKRVLLIGGPTACNSEAVKKVFNVSDTIQMSDTNAYDMMDKKYEEIIKIVNRYKVVIPALGWASNVLAYRLHRDLRYFNFKYVDVGSVIDAIAGVKTRSWIVKNQAIIAANIERILE